MSLRKDIEDAVLERLAALKVDQPSGYLRTLKPYQGSLTPDDEDADVNRVTLGAHPAVLVTTGNAGFTGYTTSHLRFTGRVQLMLFIICDNLRSPEKSARGDSHQADPGIYGILEDVRDLLCGQYLDVDGTDMPRLVSEVGLVRSASKEIWMATYEVVAEIFVDPDADAAEYETVRTEINEPEEDDANPILSAESDISGA